MWSLLMSMLFLSDKVVEKGGRAEEGTSGGAGAAGPLVIGPGSVLLLVVDLALEAVVVLVVVLVLLFVVFSVVTVFCKVYIE